MITCDNKRIFASMVYFKTLICLVKWNRSLHIKIWWAQKESEQGYFWCVKRRRFSLFSKLQVRACFTCMRIQCHLTRTFPHSMKKFKAHGFLENIIQKPTEHCLSPCLQAICLGQYNVAVRKKFTKSSTVNSTTATHRCKYLLYVYYCSNATVCRSLMV